MRSGIAFIGMKPLGSGIATRPMTVACKWIADFKIPTAQNSCERGGTRVIGLCGRNSAQPNERIGDTTVTGQDISGRGLPIPIAEGVK
jgi:hypothetical protein